MNNNNNDFSPFPKVIGIITGIIIFASLSNFLGAGLFSASPFGIFLMIGPFLIAFIGGLFVALILQYIADLFN